jgi:hypothetical protein
LANSLDRWREARRTLVEIENPLAECGHCGFTNSLTGTWSVEDGRLVFRADPNPLTRRGPNFHYCGESSETAEFTQITVDDKPLTSEDVTALQAAEQAADEAEWAAIGSREHADAKEARRTVNDSRD